VLHLRTAVVFVVAALFTAAPAEAAKKLTMKQAKKETSRVADAESNESDAVVTFVGDCKRKSRREISCTYTLESYSERVACDRRVDVVRLAGRVRSFREPIGCGSTEHKYKPDDVYTGP
jgi:hypothetical protein